MDLNTFETETSRLLTVFSFDAALFAVDALRVQEIIRVGPITPVHHAPAHVLGIINLRGRIVTILDPACRMQLGPQEPGPESRILILDWQNEQIGLLVAQVHDMLSAEPDQITLPPSNLKQNLGAFLSGMVQFRDHMVSVLDLQPLLNLEDSV